MRDEVRRFEAGLNCRVFRQTATSSWLKASNYCEEISLGFRVSDFQRGRHEVGNFREQMKSTCFRSDTSSDVYVDVCIRSYTDVRLEAYTTTCTVHHTCIQHFKHDAELKTTADIVS